MTAYPVHYQLDRAERFTRVQLLVRAVAFMALGVVGLSFGTVFVFAFIALPAFAASRLATHGPDRYVLEDGRRVVKALHWFAALCAWAGLTADRLPGARPGEVVRFEIEDGAAGTPTVGRAIWRIVTGVPSALVLFVLGVIGVVVWLWAALSILFVERVGPGAFAYLAGLQRWSIRLLAYQASLVDAYPPFSFSEQLPQLPHARAAG